MQRGSPGMADNKSHQHAAVERRRLPKAHALHESLSTPMLPGRSTVTHHGGRTVASVADTPSLMKRGGAASAASLLRGLRPETHLPTGSASGTARLRSLDAARTGAASEATRASTAALEEKHSMTSSSASVLPTWLVEREGFKQLSGLDVSHLEGQRDGAYYMRPRSIARPPSASWLGKHARPATAVSTEPDNVVRGPHGTPAAWLKPELRPPTARRRSIVDLSPRTLGLSDSAAALLPNLLQRERLVGETMEEWRRRETSGVTARRRVDPVAAMNETIALLAHSASAPTLSLPGEAARARSADASQTAVPRLADLPTSAFLTDTQRRLAGVLASTLSEQQRNAAPPPSIEELFTARSGSRSARRGSRAVGGTMQARTHGGAADTPSTSSDLHQQLAAMSRAALLGQPTPRIGEGTARTPLDAAAHAFAQTTNRTTESRTKLKEADARTASGDRKDAKRDRQAMVAKPAARSSPENDVSGDDEGPRVRWMNELADDSEGEEAADGPSFPAARLRTMATRGRTTRATQAHVDYAEAERLMQRAFTLRARALGLEDIATQRAQGNLMRLYLAQGKKEDAEQIRDAPMAHLSMIETQLEAYDKGIRREELSRKLKFAAKSAAVTALLRRDVGGGEPAADEDDDDRPAGSDVPATSAGPGFMQPAQQRPRAGHAPGDQDDSSGSEGGSLSPSRAAASPSPTESRMASLAGLNAAMRAAAGLVQSAGDSPPARPKLDAPRTGALQRRPSGDDADRKAAPADRGRAARLRTAASQASERRSRARNSAGRGDTSDEDVDPGSAESRQPSAADARAGAAVSGLGRLGGDVVADVFAAAKSSGLLHAWRRPATGPDSEPGAQAREIPSPLVAALAGLRPPLDMSSYPAREDYSARVLLQDGGVTQPVTLAGIPDARLRMNAATGPAELDLHIIPPHARLISMVFGEPLRVRYEYQHDEGVRGADHHPSDWIGLFRVINRTQSAASKTPAPSRPASRGASPEPGSRASAAGEDDLYVDFAHGRRLQASRPASRSNTASRPRASSVGADNEARAAISEDALAQAAVDAAHAENISEFRDPTRAVCLNHRTCFNPLDIPAVRSRVETYIRKQLHKGTPPAVNDVLAMVHHYDDAEVPEQFDEVLDAWLLVPQGHRGTVTFPVSHPSRLGVFRLRYFLQGTAVSKGLPLVVRVREVVCEVNAPEEVICGEGLRAAFVLHYNLSSFNAQQAASDGTASPAKPAPRFRRLSAMLGSANKAAAVRKALMQKAAEILVRPIEEQEDGGKPEGYQEPSREIKAFSAVAASKTGHRGGSDSARDGARDASDARTGQHQLPAGKTRVWAGLFMLLPRKSRWRKVAVMLNAIGRSQAGDAAPAETLGLAGPPRPPMQAPYDPKKPIEAHWLPRVHKGQVWFGAPPNGTGMAVGHPLWPGVYQVRLYTVDPGLTPTIDGIEMPRHDAGSSTLPLLRPGMVISRCVAVSKRIFARMRTPPLAPPFPVMAPLRREMRVYIAASTIGTTTERDALLKQALPQLRRLCDQRCVSLTFVDLRQRLVQKQALRPVEDADTVVITGTGSSGPVRAAGGGRRSSSAGASAAAAAAAAAAASTGPGGRRGSITRIGGGDDTAGSSGARGRRGSTTSPAESPQPVPVGAQYSYRADLPRLLCEALQEIEECRPHVVCLVGQSYDLIPPSPWIPEWLPFAFPWLRHYRNPEVPLPHDRQLAFQEHQGPGAWRQVRRNVTGMDRGHAVAATLGGAAVAADTAENRAGQPTLGRILFGRSRDTGNAAMLDDADEGGQEDGYVPQYVFPRQDLGGASMASYASVLDLEIMSAFGVPLYDIPPVYMARARRIEAVSAPNGERSGSATTPVRTAASSPMLRSARSGTSGPLSPAGIAASRSDRHGSFFLTEMPREHSPERTKPPPPPLAPKETRMAALKRQLGARPPKGIVLPADAARHQPAPIEEVTAAHGTPGNNAANAYAHHKAIPLFAAAAYGPYAMALYAETPTVVLDQQTPAQQTTALLGHMVDDATSHCYIYGRHPSMMQPLNPAEGYLNDRYGIDARATELALVHLRNESARRGDKLHLGYHRPTELVQWVLGDMVAALEDAFPTEAVPRAPDMWTVGVGAYQASRGGMFAYCSATATAMRRLNDYALNTCARVKPLCVLSMPGAGKSALIGQWARMFVRVSMDSTVRFLERSIERARRKAHMNAEAAALAAIADARDMKDAAALTAASSMLTRVRTAAASAGVKLRGDEEVETRARSVSAPRPPTRSFVLPASGRMYSGSVPADPDGGSSSESHGTDDEWSPATSESEQEKDKAAETRRMLGAQLAAALAFAAMGRRATAEWELATCLPPPTAAHARLRFANAAGDDVTMLVLHAGEAGCPSSGLELVTWLCNELVAAAAVQACYDLESVQAVLSGQPIPGVTDPDGLGPFAHVEASPKPLQELLSRMYGHQFLPLFRRADDSHLVAVENSATALREAMLRAEGDATIRRLVLRLLCAFTGDYESAAVEDEDDATEPGSGTARSTQPAPAQSNGAGGLASRRTRTRRRLLLVLDGIDHITANDDVAGALHGTRVTPAAVAVASRPRRRSSVMLDPQAVSLLSQGVKVPMRNASITALPTGPAFASRPAASPARRSSAAGSMVGSQGFDGNDEEAIITAMTSSTALEAAAAEMMPVESRDAAGTANGAGGVSFVNKPPPPLWYLPTRVPPLINIVVSASMNTATNDVLRSRGWLSTEQGKRKPQDANTGRTKGGTTARERGPGRGRGRADGAGAAAAAHVDDGSLRAGLTRQPSVRSNMLHALLDRMESKGGVPPQLAPVRAGVSGTGMTARPSSRGSSGSHSPRRAPPPPPRGAILIPAMPPNISAVERRRQRAMAALERETERATRISENLYVPLLNASIAEQVLKTAWSYGARGIGAEWADNTGWPFKAMLRLPAPREISFVSYVPPVTGDPEAVGAGVLFLGSAGATATRPRRLSSGGAAAAALLGGPPRRRSSVIDAAAAAHATANAAAAARAIIPAVTAATTVASVGGGAPQPSSSPTPAAHGTGAHAPSGKERLRAITTDIAALDAPSLAMLKSPTRGRMLASLEGRIRTFGDALAAAMRAGTGAIAAPSAAADQKLPRTLAQLARRASSVGAAAERSAGKRERRPSNAGDQARAQFIPPTNPLDVADRAAVAPRASDTLQDAITRILTTEVVTELRREGPAGHASTEGMGFAGEFDLRSAANAASHRSALHRRPAFLRLATARLALCTAPEQALSTAARLRLCTSMQDVVTELLMVLEAEYPLAIEVLCFLRVCAGGLQEQELVDLLGGGLGHIRPSPHHRPPLLHDKALQSAMQVQVTHAALSKQYQLALAQAMGHVSAQMNAQLSKGKLPGTTGGVHEEDGVGGSGGGAAANAGSSGPAAGVPNVQTSSGGSGGKASRTVAPPTHPSLLPKCLEVPPRSAPIFTPRAWAAARRALLSCFVVRARGLWCLDGGAIRAAIDRWLLPSRAQRVVYLQHLAAHFWMQPASQRKAEELVPALTALMESARQVENRDPLWQLRGRGPGSPNAVTAHAHAGATFDDDSEPMSFLPFGIVPGDFLTPAASEAMLAVESNHRMAARVAVALKSVRSPRTRSSHDAGVPALTRASSGASSAEAAPFAFAVNDGSGGRAGGDTASVVATSVIADRTDQQRAAINAALSAGTPEALRSVAVAQVHSLLERRPSYMLLCGYPPTAALPVHEALLSGGLLTVCTDMRFLMFTFRAGRPLRDLLLMGLINTLRTSVQLAAALRASFEAYHGINGYNRAPAYHLLRGAVIDPNYSKELEELDTMGRMRRQREKKTSSIAHGGVLVNDGMFMAIRRKGVVQLYAIGDLLYELGQYTGAQSMLEASVLLNLAGYDGREEAPSSARGGSHGVSGTPAGPGQPQIKALSLMVPGFQTFIHKLTVALDLLRRPPGSLEVQPDANELMQEDQLRPVLEVRHVPPAPPRMRSASDGERPVPEEPRTAVSGNATGHNNVPAAAVAPADTPAPTMMGASTRLQTTPSKLSSVTATARGLQSPRSGRTGKGPVPQLDLGGTRSTGGPGGAMTAQAVPHGTQDSAYSFSHLPMVAGHAAWDIPSLSMADMLALTINNAAVRNVQAAGNGEQRAGEHVETDDDSSASGLERGETIPSALVARQHDSVLAATRGKTMLGRDTMVDAGRQREVEDIDALIMRVSAAPGGRRSRVVDGATGGTSQIITTSQSMSALTRPTVNVAKPFMHTYVSPEARTTAMLAAVVRNAVHDGDEALKLMDSINRTLDAGPATGSGAMGTSSKTGAGASWTGGATAGGKTSRPGATSRKGAAANDTARAGVGAATDGTASTNPAHVGYGPSTSPTPQIQDVELLAQALGRLAQLYAERLRAYVRFIQLQMASDLAKAMAQAGEGPMFSGTLTNAGVYARPGSPGKRDFRRRSASPRHSGDTPAASRSRYRSRRAASDDEESAPRDARGRRLSTAFPLAASSAMPATGAVFEVHPQNIANKLLAIHKLAVQVDRVVGPRHPALLLVGKAMRAAADVRTELQDLGYLLVLEESEGLMAVRRKRVRPASAGDRGRGGAAGGRSHAATATSP